MLPLDSIAFEICQPTQISKTPEAEPSGPVSRKSERGFHLFFVCFLFLNFTYW